MPSLLGYWNIRGFAQPIRYLLEYVGEEYEEKKYPYPHPPITWDEYLKTGEWGVDKANFKKNGLLFANLPYYKDDQVPDMLFQSGAILRYLGRKHHLSGSTESEHQRIDFLFEQLSDFKTGLLQTEYHEASLEEYLALTREHLRALSQLLGEDPWFAGPKITCIDFFLYEFLVWHRDVPAYRLLDEMSQEASNLTAYCQRFEALPAIKAFMLSDRFIKWPFFLGVHGGPTSKPD